MSFTENNSWYGGYVRKDAPMVPAAKVAELESETNDLALRAQDAEGQIERIHRMLDVIGIRRLQGNGLPYSAEGRLRMLLVEREI